MYCVDLIVIFASAMGIAARARNKGHVGLLFGAIHFVFVFGCEVTGVIISLLVCLINNPNLKKEMVFTPLLVGAAVGVSVGISFMFLVVNLLPQLKPKRDEWTGRRRARRIAEQEEIGDDIERRDL